MAVNLTQAASSADMTYLTEKQRKGHPNAV